MKKLFFAVFVVFIASNLFLTGCSGNSEIKERAREGIRFLASEDEEGFRELYHPDHNAFDFEIYLKNLPSNIDLSDEIKDIQTVSFNFSSEKSGEGKIRYTNAEYKVITEGDLTYYLVVTYMSDDNGEGFKQFSVTLLGSDSK